MQQKTLVILVVAAVVVTAIIFAILRTGIKDQSISEQTPPASQPGSVPEAVRPQPTIRAVSPNGGESYRIGDTITLRSAGGYMNDIQRISMNYFLVDRAGVAREIQFGENTLTWKIGTFRDGTLVTPGDYKLRVVSSILGCSSGMQCAKPIEDESDEWFAIRTR